jgi:hypothetical protein
LPAHLQDLPAHLQPITQFGKLRDDRDLEREAQRARYDTNDDDDDDDYSMVFYFSLLLFLLYI